MHSAQEVEEEILTIWAATNTRHLTSWTDMIDIGQNASHLAS